MDIILRMMIINSTITVASVRCGSTICPVTLFVKWRAHIYTCVPLFVCVCCCMVVVLVSLRMAKFTVQPRYAAERMKGRSGRQGREGRVIRAWGEDKTEENRWRAIYSHTGLCQN